jgi:hypothetical protein
MLSDPDTGAAGRAMQAMPKTGRADVAEHERALMGELASA